MSASQTPHDPIYINGNSDFSDGDDDGVINSGASGTEGEERERLVRELVKELPEMDALEGVSNRALLRALKISRRDRA